MKNKIQNPKTMSRRLAIMLFPIFVLLMANSAIAQITLNKTVVQSNVCNQFNVSLQIAGVAAPAPVDAILVIDRSGSMAWGSPSSMSYAKTAAINFVRKLFNPTNNPGNINRIGIVSYSNTATLNRQLSYASDSSAIITAINNMVANGSTNIADGFYQAGKEMKNRGRTACNVLRSIVLFTDGVANEGSTYDAGNDRYAGSSCTSSPTSPTACTNQAIAQGLAAQSFVAGGVPFPTKVYTVGLFGGISGGVQTLAASTLNSAQNGGFFQTESAADLNGIFNQILNQLLWAAKAIPNYPMVSDTIINGFSMVPGTLAYSKGSGVLNGQVISWTTDYVNTETVTITYTVEGVTSNSCGINQTSSSWMNFQNAACEIINMKFTSPDVCVPCPQVSGIAITQSGCSSTILYTANIVSPETNCNIGTQFYSWEFFLGGQSVGTATGLTGTFTIPPQYATPTCNGTIKGVLSYNSGSGCTLIMGENSLTSTLIIDNAGPAITTTANSLDRTLQCSDATGINNALTLIPAATDLCTAVPIIHLVSDSSVTDPNCPNAYVRTRTWNFTDGCGNASLNFTQVITVIDNIAPTLTGILPVGQTNMNLCYANIPAGPSANDIKALYTDNCGGNVIVTKSGSPTGNDCNWSVTYTYEVKDACNNIVSPSPTITYTGNDQTAPSLSGTAFSSATLFNACYANALTAVPAWTQANSILGYTDNCGGNVTATLTNTAKTGNDCNWTVTYTYTVFDACNNALTNQSYSYSGKDQTSPSLTGILPIGQNNMDLCFNNIPLGPTEDDIKALYTDNCGGDVIVTKSGSPTGTDCNWSVTYTYEVKDACNNIVTPSPTVIYSGGDISVPTIVCPSVPSSVWPNSGQNYIQSGASWDATATDNCSTPIVVFTLSGATTSPNYLSSLDGVTFNYGSTLVTWIATDACGNADSCTYTIEVSDNTPPTINCPSTINVTCLDLVPVAYASLIEFINAGGSVSDNTAIDSSSFTLISESSDLQTCPETITRIYQIADLIGNTSQCTQIIIVNDTIDPTITTPASGQTVECDGAGNTDALNAWLVSNGGAEASDNCSAITWSNDFTSLSDLCGATGSAVVTFTATDACGNISTSSATFTIVDLTTPSISTQAADLTVECDGDGNTADLNAWLASNGGAEASDDCSGITWSNNFSTLSDLCGATGSAVVTFTATDDCGNISTSSATFTIVDSTDPSITTQSSDLTVECDGAGNTADLNAWLASNGGAAASDICSGIVTWTNDFTSLSDLCGATGSAVVTFTATDDCGNTSTSSATFTIVDLTAPSIATQATDLTVECDGAGNTADLNAWLASNGGAAASDICSGIVTWTNDFTSLSDLCGATGSAIVTFTATDDCGNTSTSSATFTIVDLKAPSITTQATDLTVECDGAGNTADLNAWLASNGGAAASDICSGIVTWTNDFTSLSDLCGATGSAMVTFTATDDCGNTSTSSATFTIVDSTDPSITTQASDLTVECDGAGNTAALNAWLASNGGAAASDICSGTVIWTNDFTSLSNLCGATGSSVVTFTATDDCGNTSTSSATFTIVDLTSPSITTQAADQTVECDGAGNTAALNAWLASNGGAAASDICSGTVTWTNDFTSLSNLCGATGSAVVTFTATDDCGNTSTSSATFAIIDTTAPVLTCPADITVNNDADSCGANIIITQPTYVENCGSVTIINSVNQTANASGYYPVGTTNVIWTATDDCGNISSCTMTVTVIDNELPEIICPDSIVSCSLQFNLGTPNVSDNCGVASVTNDAPSTFPIGLTVVTWTVTDIHGNMASCTQNVHVSTLNVNLEGTTVLTCFNSDDGVIMVTVTGGVEPYTYLINGGAPQTSNIFDSLPAGNYIITVYDVNQCQVNENYTIGNQDPLEVKVGKYTDANCAGKRNGEIGLDVNGGVGPYDYSWSNGANSETISNLDAGVYEVTITDYNGCELRYSHPVDTGEFEEPLVITNAFSPNGDGVNETWVIRNIDLYPENEAIVVNRWGNEVFSMKDYKNNWDGSNLAEGTYLYILKINICDEPRTLEGYITIIR